MDIGPLLDSTESYVKLPMREDTLREVDSDAEKRLALTLIHRYSETRPKGELKSNQCEWEVCIGRLERKPRYKLARPRLFPSKHLDLDALPANPPYNSLRSVAHAVIRV